MSTVDQKVIDGVLEEWGTYLFGQAKPTKKARRVQLPALAGAGRIGTGGIAGSGPRYSAAAVRAKLILTTRKAPEVMVKISGSAKTLVKIKNHLDYISRNGDVSLETESGEILTGRDQVRELRDGWRDFGDPLPEVSKFRETINVVLSMPPGTDRLSVTRAARDFATDIFAANHQYVFAVHTDEAHPHVHLVIKARGFNGRRLNPNKSALQKWRDTFAVKLGAHGITANSTKRIVRGETRQAKPQRTAHMRQEGRAVTSAFDEARAPSAQVKARTKNRLDKTINAYGHLAKALANSADPNDRELALQMVKFMKEMPALQERLQTHNKGAIGPRVGAGVVSVQKKDVAVRAAEKEKPVDQDKPKLKR